MTQEFEASLQASLARIATALETIAANSPTQYSDLRKAVEMLEE